MFKSWQEIQKEEDEQRHYFWDGTLNPRFTEGNFKPSFVFHSYLYPKDFFKVNNTIQITRMLKAQVQHQ